MDFTVISVNQKEKRVVAMADATEDEAGGVIVFTHHPSVMSLGDRVGDKWRVTVNVLPDE